MTSPLGLLLPAELLIHCLNTALAAVVACTIGMVVSRRTAWSLPARHAVLVAALAASVLAPLMAPLLPVPARWTIQGPQTAASPPRASAGRPDGNVREMDITNSPDWESHPVAEATPDPSSISDQGANVRDVVAHAPALPAPGPEQLSSATTVWAWRGGSLLCGLWFVGIAIGLVRAILFFVRFQRWMQTVSVVESPLLAAAVRWAADGVGLKNAVPVYCSKLLPAPVTLGLFRPQIVVPAGIETILPPDQLRAVIQHEMAHVARRDLWIGLLQQVAQISHWWNPLVHLANRQLADLREQICDDIAVRDLPEPNAYAATLIRIAERCSLGATVPLTLGIGASPVRQLENRIRRIVSSPRTTCVRLSRTAAVGVSAVTVLMTATILLAQVQVEPAAQESANRAGTNPAEQPDDHPTAIESAPATKTEKPLTLDELRPLVADQMRSIRSLYVAYTRIPPAEFGGASSGHVWAEQGSKMLKYDLPGKSTVPYASTFDGQQTYVGDFQGDKPVKADAKEGLIPGFHQSLQTTLLGWLHFGGQRETIADVIGAPTARLVEGEANDEAPGPTIEVKNYNRPASKSFMDVTIVLDLAHGYLPRSIAYYSVANPSWKFGYEVDKFQKVRDGATGKERWFPSTVRYQQQTPERGEQVFTTTISKLQINDLLPDELFVLAPVTPTAAPDQEAQALAEFEKVYRLAPEQLVRRVKPPYLSGRMVNLKKRWASAFAQADYENSGTFLPMVYPEQDGKLGQPGFRFTTNVSQSGIPASELLNAVGAALKLAPREIDDPEKLLARLVEGDYVIRADAPAERVIAALGQLLKNDCGIPVELELRHIEHPVVAIGGRINPPFVVAPETVVELYVTEPPSDEGEIEQGRFYDFLQAVARFIDPDRRLVNQVENAPYRNETLSWHRTPRAEKDKAVLDTAQARAALDHLEKQTGLTFSLETRKFPTTFVLRSN